MKNVFLAVVVLACTLALIGLANKGLAKMGDVAAGPQYYSWYINYDILHVYPEEYLIESESGEIWVQLNSLREFTDYMEELSVRIVGIDVLVDGTDMIPKGPYNSDSEPFYLTEIAYWQEVEPNIYFAVRDTCAMVIYSDDPNDQWDLKVIWR